MTDRPDDHAPDAGGAADFGEFGDETRKLLGAVQDWTRRTFPAPPNGHGGPECQWCPLCQLVAAMRGERPELTERIAEAGAAIANAVRALAESAPPRAGERDAGVPGDADADADAAARPERPGPRPRVQRISLDGTDDAGDPSTGGTDDAGGAYRPDRW